MAGAKSSLMFLKFQYLPAPRSHACSKHMLTDKRTGFAKGFPISGRKSARWSGTMRLFTKGKKKYFHTYSKWFSQINQWSVQCGLLIKASRGKWIPPEHSTILTKLLWPNQPDADCPWGQLSLLVSPWGSVLSPKLEGGFSLTFQTGLVTGSWNNWLGTAKEQTRNPYCLCD